MQFTPQHLSLFLSVSKDINPLHHDSDYARRAAFDKPVVFGMCAVVYCLAHWARGRRFLLQSLAADFKKPLEVGIEYEIKTVEKPRSVKMEIFRGAVVQAKLEFSTNHQTPGFLTADVQRGTSTPEENLVYECLSMEYEPNSEKIVEFYNCFGLSKDQIPASQLSFLLWTSFFIGTEFPGTQALFSGLQVDFEKSPTKGPPIRVSNIRGIEDERFQLDRADGEGTGVRSFVLEAFRRPPQIKYSIDEIRSGVGSSKQLEGSKILITGASRGYGAVLARTLALHGATVALNYRAGRSEAESIAEEIRSLGQEGVLLEGDIGDVNNARLFRDILKREFGFINTIIHNAFPAIRSNRFLEQAPDDFLGFVTKAIGLVTTPTFELLPLLRENGSMYLVSTIFVQNPQIGFSHYLAAKMAAEGVLKSLALEFPKLHFETVYLPKMRTDQTARPGLTEAVESPIDLSLKILKRLVQSSTTYTGDHATL